MTRYWYVHHESESVDFTYKEDEIYHMMEHELVEPISEEFAEELIRKGYFFDKKRLNSSC